MARPGIPKEQKLKESQLVNEHFCAAQEKNANLSQTDIANEIGKTQGLIGQWMTGKTAIPDRYLIWLGSRLGFDPSQVRPSILEYVNAAQEGSAGHMAAPESIKQRIRLKREFNELVDKAEDPRFLEQLLETARLYDKKNS